MRVSLNSKHLYELSNCVWYFVKYFHFLSFIYWLYLVRNDIEATNCHIFTINYLVYIVYCYWLVMSMLCILSWLVRPENCPRQRQPWRSAQICEELSSSAAGGWRHVCQWCGVGNNPADTGRAGRRSPREGSRFYIFLLAFVTQREFVSPQFWALL